MQVKLLLFLITCVFPVAASVDDRLQEAEAAYCLGETSDDLTKAQQAINQALSIYHSLPVEKQNAKLYHNIGNCYYRLGEYPWAVLYYKRAKVLEPRNAKIQRALTQALTQAGIREENCQDPWLTRLLGSNYISMSERIWLSAGCGLLLVLAASLALWSRRRSLFTLSLGLAVMALLCLTGLALSQYGVSPQAIVVKGSLLRIDGGHHYATVREKPLLPGQEVSLKGLVSESGWAEVVTRQGERGYIPCENLRIL